MKKVAIVQQYVPGYRVDFYQHLTRELSIRDIELTIAHGQPWGNDLHRSDARPLDGTVQLPQRTVPIAGRHLIWRDISSLANTCDALILGQSVHSLENYPALLRRRGPRVGLWGHGDTYTRNHGAALRIAKRALTLRAHWFFAYTQAGAQYVIKQGFPARHVTVVRNALDTNGLTAAKSRILESELVSLSRAYRLAPGRTALYVGGLDAPKRIPFLLTAAAELARLLPGFRLLIAGDGAQRHLVEEAHNADGPVAYLGTASDEDKARLGAVADVLLAPGAVGLVAVDSFALHTPLVTTAHAMHGPEFEYLQHGRNALIVTGTAETYAKAVAQLLNNPVRLEELRAACKNDAHKYTIEAMAARFADGVEGLLRAPVLPRRPFSFRGRSGRRTNGVTRVTKDCAVTMGQ